MRTSKFASALSQAFEEFIYRRQDSRDDMMEAIASSGALDKYLAHNENTEEILHEMLDKFPSERQALLELDSSYRAIHRIVSEAEYRHGFMDALHLVRFFIEEDDARSASLFCPADGGARQRVYNNLGGGKYND